MQICDFSSSMRKVFIFLMLIKRSCSFKPYRGMNLIFWCLSIYKLKTVSSDRASPSTREAIAGMLSFSQQSYSTTSSSTKSSKRSIKNQQNDDEDDDQLIENIDKVHQDDDFSMYIMKEELKLFLYQYFLAIPLLNLCYSQFIQL